MAVHEGAVCVQWGDQGGSDVSFTTPGPLPMTLRAMSYIMVHAASQQTESQSDREASCFAKGQLRCAPARPCALVRCSAPQHCALSTVLHHHDVQQISPFRGMCKWRSAGGCCFISDFRIATDLSSEPDCVNCLGARMRRC